MAEERMIDDEYGRGVKLRKTKDGYVDVTDETLDNAEEEEFSFAFPAMEEEDDEDLVGLSPEEAAKLRQKKKEEAAKLRAEYDKVVAEGEALLKERKFAEAEVKFEIALKLDGIATEASVGYWRAKTANFENPDVLIEEYVEPGIESLEYDLGYEAADIIKREHREVFEKRRKELDDEAQPLLKAYEEKQARRREILKGRKKNRILAFVASALPMVACIVLAIVFGLKNFSTPDGKYIPLTIGLAAGAAVLFIVFAVCTNKLINTFRICKANENMSATEDGEYLFHIMECRDLYDELLKVVEDEEPIDYQAE